jgi:hypothetical protein
MVGVTSERLSPSWRRPVLHHRSIRSPEHGTAVLECQAEPTRLMDDPMVTPAEQDQITLSDAKGQFSKKTAFFVRLNNGTRAIDDEREIQRYIAQRWAQP